MSINEMTTANRPVDPNDDFETQIRGVGEQLHRLARYRRPFFLTRRWAHEKALEHFLTDETFKVQLFQFIDVLPTLRTPAQIARLLNEYFPGDSLPYPLGFALGILPKFPLGTRAVAMLIHRQVRRFARRFILAPTLPESVGPLRNSWHRGRAFSLDLLGEEVVSEDEADLFCERYLDALDVLGRGSRNWPSRPLLESDHHGRLPRIHLSIKLSSLYSQLDPIAPERSFMEVAPRLRAILRAAKRVPAAVTIDMESYHFKDLVFEIAERIFLEDEFRSFPHAGVALQAYLRDSEDDARSLISWVGRREQPFHVRLVKGAYWDYERIISEQRGWPSPVFDRKSETDNNFERLTNVLFDHIDLLRPAIGSHNIRSVAHAIVAARRKGLPDHAYEIQMLYGIADPLKDAICHINLRLREYAPVGDLLQGMAYLVRRLLENTANESILPRQFSSKVDLDAVFSNPALTMPPSPLSSPPRGGRGEGEGGDFHHALVGRRPMRTAEADRRAGTDGPRPAASHAENRKFRNEPLTDFSRSWAREEMKQALASVQQQILDENRRAACRGDDMRCLVSRNPSKMSDVVWRVPMATPEDVDIAIGKARKASAAWAAADPESRAKVLFTAAAALRRRRLELAAWEVVEVGKSWCEADADVAEATDFLEFYGREMVRLGSPERLDYYPGESNSLRYRPRGLAAVLSPWNFPLAIPAGMVAAALVTGNGVLFKPSERSPRLGALLTEVFYSSGLPADILHVLPGGPETGKYLVEHPEIRIIAFTGSKRVGLDILKAASTPRAGQRDIKKVIAEMGGKNAIIVDATADLDEAVRGVLKSAFGFQGQKCSACSRVIVLRAIRDQFTSRLIAATGSLAIGPPHDPQYVIGPVIDRRAMSMITEYIDLGNREAVVGLSHNSPPLDLGDGCYVKPMIFLNVPPDSRLAREEVFGPVLAVFTAADFDEALRIANATDYGLTGGLFSRSPRNIARAKDTLEVGNLYINRGITGALVGCQPFGGFHLSGTGAKAGGREYLTQFMVAQSITEQTLRRGFAPTSGS